MQVKQFYNKNQFIITNGNETTFQSYDSTIANYNENDNKLEIFIDWDYSHTTLKHFYLFLKEYLSRFYYHYLDGKINKREAFEKLLNTTTNEGLTIIKQY